MVAKYLNINIFCGDLARRVAHGYILLEDSIVSTAHLLTQPSCRSAIMDATLLTDVCGRWKINDLRLLLEENAIPGKVFGL
jgi:hypothetical protein